MAVGSRAPASPEPAAAAGEKARLRPQVREATAILGPVLVGILAAAAPGSTAEAAGCGSLGPASIEVVVREAPLSVRTDLSLAELGEMSAQFSREARHPVLGLYSVSVGYVLRRVAVDALPPSRSRGPPCLYVVVQAELVATDQRIEVGRDLLDDPCRLHAAIAHCGHHAAAASLALKRLAAELPHKLGPQVDRYVAGHPVRPGAGDSALQNYVGSLLDQAVGAFIALLPGVQSDVDTAEEARILAMPCSDT